MTTVPTPLDLFAGLPNAATVGELPVQPIALELIQPDPDQPRTGADDELQSQVSTHGIRPIVVTPAPTNDKRVDPGVKYWILDGERRYLGATKAGLTTIPAQIDHTPYTALQRLVRQAALNHHKQLSPMDEAAMFKRVQDESGWSEQQIADVFKRKKSTVADRLALVNMPQCFQQMFIDGLLSAAAAPIVRKFLGVPITILEHAAKFAPADLAWQQAKAAGKAVELKDVGRVLDKIILAERMRELPESLLLIYKSLGGVTCKVAGDEYAVDIPKFVEAQSKHDRDRKRGDDEPMKASVFKQQPANTNAASFDNIGMAGSGGDDDLWESAGAATSPDDDSEEDDVGTTPAVSQAKAQARASAPSTLSAAERKRQAKLDEERRLEDLKKKAWQKAKPQLLRAIAAALKIAPTDAKGPLGGFLLECLAHSTGADWETVEELLPRGSTAQDLVRHLVMVQLHTDIMTDFNAEGMPRRLRELTLKVDVARILDEAMKTLAKGEQPSNASRSAGTPKRGGRPLTPPAPTSPSAKAKPSPKTKAPAKKKAATKAKPKSRKR